MRLELSRMKAQGCCYLWWGVIYFHKISYSRYKNKGSDLFLEDNFVANRPVTQSLNREHNYAGLLVLWLYRMQKFLGTISSLNLLLWESMTYDSFGLSFTQGTWTIRIFFLSILCRD